MEKVLERLYKPELEKAVLSCALINPDTWAEMAIRPSDFHDHRNMLIATVIERLLKSGNHVDILTVGEELKKHNSLEEINWFSYLTELANSAESSLHASTYANQLKEATTRVRLVNSAQFIVNLALNTEKPITTVTAEARQLLDGALNSANTPRGRSLADALKEFDEGIESKKGKPFSLLGISTGYQDIDHKLDGLQNGWLYLIAARPGNGKTAMLGNLAINVAKQNKKVLFFSAEMNDLRIVARMVAAETGINADILKHGAMETETEWTKYYRAIETFEALPMRLYKPDECRSVEQIETITRQLYAQGEADIIFVDYLQLLQVEAGRSPTREQEVTKIAQTLKRITNINIPVVSAAQLNREAVGKPQLSNLRESGSLEQEADAVCFLHHPEDDTTDASLEFIVAKNRDGDLGDCPLYYDKTTQKIASATRKTIDLNP